MDKNKEMIRVILQIPYARNRISMSDGTHSMSTKASVSQSNIYTCKRSSTNLIKIKLYCTNICTVIKILELLVLVFIGLNNISTCPLIISNEY